MLHAGSGRRRSSATSRSARGSRSTATTARTCGRCGATPSGSRRSSGREAAARASASRSRSTRGTGRACSRTWRARSPSTAPTSSRYGGTVEDQMARNWYVGRGRRRQGAPRAAHLAAQQSTPCSTPVASRRRSSFPRSRDPASPTVGYPRSRESASAGAGCVPRTRDGIVSFATASPPVSQPTRQRSAISRGDPLELGRIGRCRRRASSAIRSPRHATGTAARRSGRARRPRARARGSSPSTKKIPAQAQPPARRAPTRSGAAARRRQASTSSPSKARTALAERVRHGTRLPLGEVDVDERLVRGDHEQVVGVRRSGRRRTRR